LVGCPRFQLKDFTFKHRKLILKLEIFVFVILFCCKKILTLVFNDIIVIGLEKLLELWEDRD
jgi:hypothetical protein